MIGDPVTKENMMDMTFTTSVMDATGAITTGTCTLGDIATWSTGTAGRRTSSGCLPYFRWNRIAIGAIQS